MTISPQLGAGRWQRVAWWTVQLLALAALAFVAWRVIAADHYRLDLDVYRLGGRAWLDGQPLYGKVRFDTQLEDTVLPFTYPPLAAVVFSPLAWLPLPTAGTVLTLATLVLLVTSLAITLTSLGVCTTKTTQSPAAWTRRWCLSAAIVAIAVWLKFEPIDSNFGYGQINAVLMTLVIADCLPRRTPWPRGLLIGLAIAVKLTPAVFLLYFLLRRDRTAALTALASFAAATLLGFALAFSDSLEYWTRAVFSPDRIGDAALNTNQNWVGVLARLHVDGAPRFVFWMLGSFVVLALTVWAARRLLRAGEPALALMCIALLGLVVSPVSWSHHWVWVLPTAVVTAIVGYRRRNVALIATAVVGVVLMRWTPIQLLHPDSDLWHQFIGVSYVWWALATIATAGATVADPAIKASARERDAAAAPAVS